MALPQVLDRFQQSILLWAAGLLVLVGLVFVYSASSILALERFGAAHYFLVRHAAHLVLALIAFCIARFVPLQWWHRWSPVLFLFFLLLTMTTLLPFLGLRCNGANRWLVIAGFSLQPSELLKPFFVLFLARFLGRRTGNIHRFKKDYLPLLVVLALVCGTLLKQPDFGAAVLLLATCLVMLFVAGWHLKHLFLAALASIPVVAWLVLTRSYRLARILIFLNPWADPQGRGFQIIQSLIAIASGGIGGVGIACSKQKFFYLPMQHTDFIFSIIAEETGFIGSVGLVLLYGMLCAAGLRIACRANTLFAALAGVGFTTLLCFQAVANLMIAAGLLPTKGLGLPLVSSGGTALIASLFMIGFLSQLAAISAE